jgi:hypothetical protein
MVLPHIFFNIEVQIFHIKECYNTTLVLKSSDISGTSQQIHVHQSTNMWVILSNITVLLHSISHVFVATRDILISLGWTTYYYDWEVSIVQVVTKRSHRKQKHLKLAVLYRWNPFIISEDVITLINKFFFYYTVTISFTTHICMEEALESISLHHCAIISHKYSCNPNILPMVSVNPTPKGTWHDMTVQPKL